MSLEDPSTSNGYELSFSFENSLDSASSANALSKEHVLSAGGDAIESTGLSDEEDDMESFVTSSDDEVEKEAYFGAKEYIAGYDTPLDKATEHSVNHGKSFLCAICGMRLPSMISYMNHSKQEHEEYEKQFVCPEVGCGKGFHREYRLRDHMFRHSGEKNFVCDNCDTPFATNADRRYHVRRVHEKNYKGTTRPRVRQSKSKKKPAPKRLAAKK